MSKMLNYIVCDRCGYLWVIHEIEPNPNECEWCQHDALWRFREYDPASEHSFTIRARKYETA